MSEDPDEIKSRSQAESAKETQRILAEKLRQIEAAKKAER